MSSARPSACRRSRPAPLAVAAAILLALGAPAWAAPQRYVVLPFENLSGEPSLTWLGEAVAMSLGDRLELLGMRTVPRDERIDAIDALSLPSTPMSLASALRLATAVRAGRLIVGSFTYDPGNGVVVNARLLDVAAAKQIWDGKRPGTLAGIFGLMDPLVLEAAASDAARVSPAAPSALSKVSDPPLPLYELVVKGLQEPDPDRRVAALQKGLEMNRRAPSVNRALAFALFDSGRLDDALARLDAMGDQGIPDAWRLHLLRARILVAKGDPGGAMAALSKSVGAGDSADAHLLAARLLSERGEANRARAEIDLAAGLDPGHPDLPRLRAVVEGRAVAGENSRP